MVAFVLFISILIQFLAAFLALKLMRITGKRTAWVAIAAAVALMALRRCISLYDALAGDPFHQPDMAVEIVSLATSSLMAAGIYFIAPLFESIRRSGDALRESEEKYRGIVENVDIGIYRNTADGRFIQANPAMARMFGYGSVEELMKVPLRDLYDNPSEREALVNDALRDGLVKNRELLLKKEDGTRIWASCTAHAQYDDKGRLKWLDSAIEDITGRRRREDELHKYRERLSELVDERTAELKKAYEDLSRETAERQNVEEQLRHSQKMEAIGRLAGGVAHDFNNRLTAIINCGYLLKMKTKADDPLVEYIDQILASSKKAASLTQGLLTFSRKQDINPVPLNLNVLIRDIKRLLEKFVGPDIAIEAALSDEDNTVVADAGQMENVLLNLAANARDAMPAGGRITIKTKSAQVDGGSPVFIVERPGRYALLSFADTGSGMDEKTIERIFEPFFTTKDAGKGTGLGLSIVYGIVKKHGGFIDVISGPGRGSTFNIYLPCSQTGPSALQAEPAVREAGSETVLLAEDDADVRVPIKEILEHFGYKVIEAVDGDEAVKAYRENSGDVSILILDIIMPKKSGIQAFEEIQKTHPEAKALFISGNNVHIEGIPEGAFISKPVTPGDLLRKLRAAIDRK